MEHVWMRERVFRRFRELLALIIFLLPCRLAQAQVWRSIGPNPLVENSVIRAGRIATIAVDPVDERHWLAGAGNGGVWETRDGGSNWIPVTDNAPTLAIGAIAFAPSDPQTIYAATGEAVGTGFVRAGAGVLKSADGGHSWTLLGASSFARASVRRVRVDPANKNIVLAISQRGGFGRDSQLGAPSPPPFGFLKSTDGGVTWNRTLAGQATALEADPTNFNNLYAAIGDNCFQVFSDTPGSVPGGVYRSVDGGQTWSPIMGPWGQSTPTIPAVGRVELAIAPSNPNVLYASIVTPAVNGCSSQKLLGLWRTDNAWAPTPTWTQIPTNSNGQGTYCDASAAQEGDKCGYVHVISVDPADPSRLFAGAFTFWRCSSCGTTPVWTSLNNGIQSDQHAIAWAGTRLVLGNDHGVYSTTDLGATWQNHNPTLLNTMFYRGALHPNRPDFILGGLRDFFPAIRVNGDRWDELQNIQGGGEWGEAEVAVSSSRPDTDWMLAAPYGVIARTTNGGQSGIYADTGIDKTGAAFVAPVRKCPSNDEVFLTGTLRMWRTNSFFNSSAPTWVANGPPGSAGPNGLQPVGAILSIAFVPADQTCNTYAYGNRGGEVYLTTDGGGTWIDLDAGHTLPARPVNGLVFDPTNPNILYVGLSSFDIATPGKPGHVFKTTNALSASPSWTSISPPIDVPFNVVAVNPGNPQLVYAGSDTGLWHSANGGAAWIANDLSVGLPPASIYDIQIQPATNRIFVFTYGRGAYVNSLPFTDDPLQSGQTIVKGVHITELRGRINGLRTRFGLGAYTWTNGSLTGVVVTAAHVTELRTALSEAFTAHSLTPPTYTDPSLLAGTIIKAVHITELRNAVITLEGS